MNPKPELQVAQKGPMLPLFFSRWRAIPVIRHCRPTYSVKQTVEIPMFQNLVASEKNRHRRLLFSVRLAVLIPFYPEYVASG